jgi:hypothetical protein
MVFSSSPTPEINAIFNQQNCANYFGKVRVANPTLAGGICQVHIWYLSPQKYIQANSQRIIVFFAQKIVTKLKTMGLGSGIWDPVSGSRGQKGSGSRILIRITAFWIGQNGKKSSYRGSE